MTSAVREAWEATQRAVAETGTPVERLAMHHCPPRVGLLRRQHSPDTDSDEDQETRQYWEGLLRQVVHIEGLAFPVMQSLCTVCT